MIAFSSVSVFYVLIFKFSPKHFTLPRCMWSPPEPCRDPGTLAQASPGRGISTGVSLAAWCQG